MLKPRTFKAIKCFKPKDIGSLLNPKYRGKNLFSSFQRYFFLKSNCKIYNWSLIGLVNLSHKRMFWTEVSKEEKKTQKPKYEEPEVPEEEMEKLKQQITRISQWMNLGMYKDAKMLLEKYKVDLSKYSGVQKNWHHVHKKWPMCKKSDTMCKKNDPWKFFLKIILSYSNFRFNNNLIY